MLRPAATSLLVPDSSTEKLLYTVRFAIRCEPVDEESKRWTPNRQVKLAYNPKAQALTH